MTGYHDEFSLNYVYSIAPSISIQNKYYKKRVERKKTYGGTDVSDNGFFY